MDEWQYFNPHCLLLFIIWNVLTIFLAGTSRWLSHYWRWYLAVHAILGSAFTSLTLWLGIRALLYLTLPLRNPDPTTHGTKSRVEANLHSIGGIFLTFMTLFLSLGGFYATHLMRTVKWDQAKLLFWRRLHKIMGWFFILLGVAVSIAGISEYYREVDVEKEIYAVYAGILFFGLLGLTELYF